MLTILLSVLLLSHLIFQLPFWHALLNRQLPNTLGFLGLGLLLYYDLGIITELIGVPYVNDWYRPALTPFDNDAIRALAILIFAPWLVMLGWLLARPFLPRTTRSVLPLTTLAPRRIMLFVLTAVAITLACDALALQFLRAARSVWESRLAIGEVLGPFTILLNVPLALLAFWLMQRQARTFWGWGLTLLLAVGSAVATLPIGQRTVVLLPFLMILVFSFRPSLPRFALAGAGLIVAASLILPLFKWQFADESRTSNLLAQTIYSDLHRANVLTSNLPVLDMQGAGLLPYPGAGYVYTATVLLPRSVAPWKGYGTSTVYTAWRDGRTPENETWALALTGLDELLLNFGPFGLLGLIFFGFLARVFDAFSTTIGGAVIPVRLAAVWFWGYDTSVIALLYGTMFVVTVAAQWIFVQNARVTRSAQGLLVLRWIGRPR